MFLKLVVTNITKQPTPFMTFVYFRSVKEARRTQLQVDRLTVKSAKCNSHPMSRFKDENITDQQRIGKWKQHLAQANR